MNCIFSDSWADYELLDAGGGKKLERFGSVITIRPEKNAYFRPVLSNAEWKSKANIEFVESGSTSGAWRMINEPVPAEWQISYSELLFNLRQTQYKHIGIFPEQRTNWDYILKRTKAGDSFLNLFAYTGAATLMARSAGANVCHCDSVKQINVWAKQNMEISNLQDVRWICDDALKFASREVKRGNLYDGIIMDPPAFGLGANRERWKIEDQIDHLIALGAELLTDDGFLIVNTYSPKVDASILLEIASSHFGVKQIESGKLCIESVTGKILEYGDLCRVDVSK